MIKEKLKSIRVKLFLTLSITLIAIVMILILANNFILEKFYLYSKQKSLMSAYEMINQAYQQENGTRSLELELEKIAIYNNFDILIKSEDNLNVYSSNRDFISDVMSNTIQIQMNQGRKNILYKKDNIVIRKSYDLQNGLTYIMMVSRLDNDYFLYMRVPIASIQESVKISNHFLYWIGGITLLVSGIMILIISKRFTKPIAELSEIADKMAKLDFSHKYQVTHADDEVNRLGNSINTMSDKLEATIKQLRNTNIELEKDIEEKSKTDEMRKQFISDVSHELKTPIALIQGYAEGLVENVVTDEESRKFYAEVILDESNKMDALVKQLLELMKLEYGKREFHNTEFSIDELIEEVIRKSRVILEEKQIQVVFEKEEKVLVYADDFYVEQVISNYFTNAIKHVKEVQGEKVIKITLEKKENLARVSIFNTGEHIAEENINRIWNRFYKEDSSRNREQDSGTGIGLSFVKAIMNNYQKEYGVKNVENGVTFYFELEAREA